VIAADDAGVCVIPLEYLGAVKDAVLEAEQAEREVTAAIRRGAPVEEVARILNPERW
jgi:regulator of RNase E activity RraA